MSTPYTSFNTITVTTDPRYGRSNHARFTAEDYPNYEERYQAASDFFDGQLERLKKNKGGMVTFGETGSGCAPLHITIDRDGEFGGLD